MTSDTQAPQAAVAPPAASGDGRKRGLSTRALAILLLLAALWVWSTVIAVSLFTVRTELTAARQLTQAGRSAMLDTDAASAHRYLQAAAAAFARAEERLTAPAMMPLRSVPVLGANLDAGNALAAAGARTASAGKEVAGAVASLPEGVQSLMPQGGAIPLEPLQQLAPALHRADALLTEAQELANLAPPRGLLPPLAEARAEFLPAVDQAAEAVSTAVTLIDVLPAFLGIDTPRRYFLGASNPAELRGTGGLIGAHAILTVDEGRLDIGGFSETHDLPTREPDEVSAPNPDYAARYTRYGGAGFWQNINMTPDFPSAASAIQTLYQQVTGEPIDGVMVVDPHALAGLLALAGPAELPSGDTVDADTVVAHVANEAYGEIEDPEERKALLGATAAAALNGFLRGDTGENPIDAVRALGDAAGGGHLLLYAADPDIQAAFEEAGVAGRLLDPEGDYLAAVVNNAAANKVDFYTDRTVHYQIQLHSDGSASATAAVELVNDAPTEGLPTYVIGPNVRGTVAGDNRSLLSVYCAAGCSRTGYRRSLSDKDLREEMELGHPVFTTMVQLGTGEAERIELDWELAHAWERDEAGGLYRLTVQDQPTIRPTTLVVEVTLPQGMTVASATEGFEWGSDRAQWTGTAEGTTELELRFLPQ